MGRAKEPGAATVTDGIDVDQLAPSLKVESALATTPAPSAPEMASPASPPVDVRPDVGNSDAAVDQDEDAYSISAPTAPRPMTPDGFELDEWGLPRVGPVRAAVLARIERTDPNIDPTGWERVPAPAAPQE